MKRVLCICPQFPPINAPDMQRLRQSLPHFSAFGWEAVVFAVDPEFVEGTCDDTLLDTLPPDVPIHYVSAFKSKLTRKVGLGNLGFRCFLQLNNAVDRYLQANQVDLIYFSTTVFTVMALGPHWKRKYGVPFIVDLQDPWRNDYYLSLAPEERPRKFWFDYRQKKALEAYTIPKADGVTAVSHHYIDTLADRYGCFSRDRAVELTFGFDNNDYQVASRRNSHTPIFEKKEDTVNFVFTGVVPPNMAPSIEILLRAMSSLPEAAGARRKFRFYFVGTHYGKSDEESQSIIGQIAERYGFEDIITEIRDRISYFDAIRLMKDADVLLLFGIKEGNYSPSKLAPYVFSMNSILSIMHEKSNIAGLLKAINPAQTVLYGDDVHYSVVSRCASVLEFILASGPEKSMAADAIRDSLSAKTKTRHLTDFFEMVVSRSTRTAGI